MREASQVPSGGMPLRKISLSVCEVVFPVMAVLPRAQTSLWRLVDTVISHTELTQTNKQDILSVVLRSAAEPGSCMPAKFAAKLAAQPWSVGSEDISLLKNSGFTDPGILDIALLTAVGQLLLSLIHI